jgi:hypothetical protein
MNRKKDIMDQILTGSDGTFSRRTRELDCLIYRSDDGEIAESSPPPTGSWKVSKGNISVEIWEGKAKIKVKFSQGIRSDISMERIASIAVDAISRELKKEEEG